MRSIILLALLSTAYGIPGHQERIVGGSPTTIDQYPYMSNMLNLWWDLFWYQACSGALLTTRTVLSPAHCIYGESPITFNVRLGTSFSWSGGHLHGVSQFILHEKYNDNTLENDVAIVILSTPAILSDTVARARIVGSTFLLPAGSIVTALGWGHTVAGGNSSEQLQHVDINIIDQQVCAERYAYLKSQPEFQDWPVVTEGMVCAGILDVGGKDSCQRDGPLAIMRDVIYGISSWGYGCGHQFYPGVNTRVAHYSGWIVEHGTNFNI